jgi:hypothetical protein
VAAENDMRETMVQSARAAADSLARLSRSDLAERASKPDSKMKIVMLARRVAAVRKEMERRTARKINE